METVKHFVWTGYDNESNPSNGRVAVRVDGDEIWFARIHGKAPYANMRAWWETLCAAFPEIADGERYMREQLRLPWCVETYYGRGVWCTSYVLRELVNADLLDAPVRARIEVSMSGKLRDFRMKLGHFHALFKNILPDAIDAGYIDITETTIKDRVWTLPYEESKEER